MQSSELAERIDRYVNLLQSNDVLIKLLNEVVDAGDKILNLAFATPTRELPNDVIPLNNETRKAIHEAVRTFKADRRGSHINRAIDKLEQDVTHFYSWLPDAKRLVELYLGVIERFRRAYDDFMNNNGEAETLRLCRTAELLYVALMRDQETFLNVRKALMPDTEPGEGRERLTVKFISFESLSEIGQKLVALANMYSEICRMLGINEDSWPLYVEKVETGSVTIIVTGVAAAVVLLGGLFAHEARYYFRHFFTRGKQQLEQQRDVLVLGAEILSLARSLQIATPDMEADVKANIQSFSKNISTFIRSNGLEINGTFVMPETGVPDQTLPKLLPASQVKQLPSTE